MNYTIDDNEVVLYEGKVGYEKNSNKVDFTLTSKKMIFEKTKGLFKKEKILVDLIELDDVKVFNEEVQVKQKMDKLQVQSTSKNFTIYFDGMIEARKVSTKIINAITGTTTAKRGSDKVKGALDLVDETLGLDTRGMVKGVVENGIKGTIINGIKGKK